MATQLPIWQLQGQIIQAVNEHDRLVLIASTGSGKSTQVPQILLDGDGSRSVIEPEQKVIVLQPRRVAARTVASRVAWERSTRLGQEVGYQVRFEDHTSLGTRISFVTEGILLRWLQNTPLLPNVGAIIFDEFHERNLLSDVALALTKRLQEAQRPDLKLVVMSATLDAQPVADYLGRSAAQEHVDQLEGADRHEHAGASSVGPPSCPVLELESRLFPVEVRYQERRDRRPIGEQAADAVERIVRSEDPGDILIFMPGMGEIRATIEAIRTRRLSERPALIPLHGELPAEEQDKAFQSSPERKIVVATNVAETSVTIDGIRHVIDSGLARIARFDAERGITTLFVEEISRASAEQRKGRAGRTAPGVCHRLWTESHHLNRAEQHAPEIQRSDLAEVVLLLHSLGIRNATKFDWLDTPDPAAVRRAEMLLRVLGALRPEAESGNSDVPDASIFDIADPSSGGLATDLTETGWKMLRLPLHPRYSRMLIEAARHRCVLISALCAALVSEKDLLTPRNRLDEAVAQARERFEPEEESDFLTLLQAYQFAEENRFDTATCRQYGIHAQAARQVRQTYDQIIQIARRQGFIGDTEEQRPQPDQLSSSQSEALLRCVMSGFIDQLCLRRSQGTLECDLTEGRTGTLVRESIVQKSLLFVAASIREVSVGKGGKPLTLLGLASRVEPDWVSETFPEQVTTQAEYRFDRPHKRVEAVHRTRFHDLVISQANLSHREALDPEAQGRCLADAYLRGDFQTKAFDHQLKQWIARVNLAAVVLPELEYPRLDDSGIRDCLARAFHGLSHSKQAQSASLAPAFHAALTPEQQEWLDELLPTQFQCPNGRTAKIVYPEKTTDKHGEIHLPEAQIKLHDCFGMESHPMLGEGRLPVKLVLTAPDGKRLDVTTDWPTFKANEYPKLKPALKRKYSGVAWI